MTGTEAHRREGAQLTGRCAVITVTDSRTVATDESGPAARRLLEAAGHTVVYSHLLPNDEAQVRETVVALIARDDVDVILLTGGTGLGSRDRTVEAVRPLLDKELPGFGEIFRAVSYAQQVGTAAILTRSLAGSARGHFVVALPGAKRAVELALENVLLPELPHLLREVRR